MLSLSEAQKVVLEKALYSSPINLPLVEASGYVLAETIQSPLALPNFDNSAMDGYAIALGENWDLPIVLQVSEFLPAGCISQHSVEFGQAIKIMTGAPIPSGANTVVPIENVRPLEDKCIEVLEITARGQHIRRMGEEVGIGQTVLEQGQILNTGAVGLLAALGYQEVPVYKPPLVAILATGNEIVPAETPLAPGKIYDSNSHILAAAVAQTGAIPVLFGIVQDDKAHLKHLLKEAVEACDVILTSGGVSVGDHDYVQEVWEELGFEKLFWKVAIKPGKPILFGTLKNKLCFGIPGNPASAIAVFEYIIRPALRQMMGYQKLWRPQIKARLTEAVMASKDRLHLLRVILKPVEAGFEVTPLRAQGSSNLLTMALANAILPVQRACFAGEDVLVDWIEQKEDH